MPSTIRLATKHDAAGIAEIYRPIVVSTPISFEIEPPDEVEIQHRIEGTLPDYPWLVCEHRGRVAGYAYASRHRVRAGYQWSVDTSVYVHPDFHRHGIGRGLYVSLFQILAAQGYVNAYAGITLPNPGSVGLHESAGFQAIGTYRKVGYKLGAWYDVGWWQLALQPLVATPQPLLRLGEIQSDPSWQRMMAAGLACLSETDLNWADARKRVDLT
jgi:L-amino acid N-acyltransferase YncA